MCNIFHTPLSFQLGGHLFRNGGCGRRLCSHTTGKVSTSHYSFGHVILCRKCNAWPFTWWRRVRRQTRRRFEKYSASYIQRTSSNSKYMLQWEPVVFLLVCVN